MSHGHWERKRECHHCKKMSKGCKVCSGCKAFLYCSRECQVANWKEHKSECKRASERAPGIEFVVGMGKSVRGMPIQTISRVALLIGIEYALCIQFICLTDKHATPKPSPRLMLLSLKAALGESPGGLPEGMSVSIESKRKIIQQGVLRTDQHEAFQSKTAFLLFWRDIRTDMVVADRKSVV